MCKKFKAKISHFDAILGSVLGNQSYPGKKPMIDSNPCPEEHLCKISEKSLVRLLRKRSTDGRTDGQG